MADYWKRISLSKEYKEFCLSFPSVTLDDLDLVLEYVTLLNDLKELEQYSKTHSAKSNNHHYINCIWSNPKGADTCICYVICALAYRVQKRLYSLYVKKVGGGEASGKLGLFRCSQFTSRCRVKQVYNSLPAIR